MKDFQLLFQHLISEIKILLTQAQSAGRIETYQLEVIFPASESAIFQKNSHDRDFSEPLYNLLHTLQKIVAEYGNPPECSKDAAVSAQDLCSPELQLRDRNMELTMKGMYGNEERNDRLFRQPHLVDSCPQNQHQNDCIDHLGQVNHFQNQSNDCLPPQQPTTKETEAANVLMNLSGKATDRANHGRIETCSRPQELTSFDGKSTVFLLPAGSASYKWDTYGKREHSMCDEVPQINEKDLLPLATQVLCQFCSRQCEDLVELHEHVLALHNVPDSELPLMPAVKKLKTTGGDDNEEKAMEQFPQNEFQNETMSSSCVVPVKNSVSLKFSIEGHGVTAKQESYRKQHTEDKTVSKRGKCKSSSYVVSYENSGEYLSGSVKSSEGKNRNKDSSCVVIKTTQNIPGEDTIQNLDAGSCLTEQSLQNITIGKDYERQIRSDEVDRLENSSHSHAPITELTPVGSDALAIAVESSQIKIIEAKVTVNVCLKCSSGYTHSQDYKNHVCSANRPFVEVSADGTVVLVDNSSLWEDHTQLHDYNAWYFPEFFIRQTLDSAKQGTHNLQIVHCTSGRKLELHTSYQPSYLGEQFISFRCPICEKDSDSFSRFLDHLTSGPCMFRCPECSLVYITQDKLQKHRASLHPNLEDRTCPMCHMVFEKRHQRNKHLKMKCSQNHICVTCGSVLKNEYNLRVHMQSHKERNLICKECGASFYRRAILQRHMMSHSGTRPHACTMCSAKFYTRQNLNIHTDRHNGFKRYPCSSCNKAYYSKHDRDNHVAKIHSKNSVGQKPAKAQEERCMNEAVAD